MVVFGVDEGDVEALVMEELGELGHGVDVALSWVRDADGMGLSLCSA